MKHALPGPITTVLQQFDYYIRRGHSVKFNQSQSMIWPSMIKLPHSDVDICFNSAILPVRKINGSGLDMHSLTFFFFTQLSDVVGSLSCWGIMRKLSIVNSSLCFQYAPCPAGMIGLHISCKTNKNAFHNVVFFVGFVSWQPENLLYANKSRDSPLKLGWWTITSTLFSLRSISWMLHFHWQLVRQTWSANFHFQF